MSPEAQMKILNLCKGMTIGQAEHRLEVMEQYVQNRILAGRFRLVGMKIGD